MMFEQVVLIMTGISAIGLKELTSQKVNGWNSRCVTVSIVA